MIPNEEEKINFYSEDIDFSLNNSPQLCNWIYRTIKSESKKLIHLNFIFCSDKYLHKINVEYLDHDTYTDVITFPYAKGDTIEGDIFISVDRIKENAIQFNVDFEHELHRVMIHGVLHLIGYGDKSIEDKELMTKKEDEYLLKYMERN